MMKKRTLFIFSFIVPALIFYSIFSLYPIVKALGISFYRWSGYSNEKCFVGLENFKRLLSDKIVWEAFKHNMYMLLIPTTFTFVISMFFAYVFTKKDFFESRFYRVVFLFPNTLSLVVIAVIWAFIYNPTFGVLNQLLKAIGLDSLVKPWLGDSDTVLKALAVPQIWMSVGFFMVLYMAGMKSIPVSLYESARIDGASEFRQYISITIPLMWEIVRTSLLFFITRAFNQTFQLVLVTTKGGPARASELLPTYMYEQAFDFGDFGYGTAIGVLIFIVMLVLFLILMGVSKKEVYEY
jgi:N-acetylglucosamine transport system permease protein